MNKELKKNQHDLISALNQLTADLGRTPIRSEFEESVVGGRYRIGKYFGGKFKELVSAAGLPTYDDRRSDPSLEKNIIKKYKALCSKKEQIQGFFRHTLDLKELFDRAGNPAVLKISAQPDTHVKFKDDLAVNSYIKFLKWYKPHVHLIMGDFADCEGLSHWPDASLAPRRIVPEMKQARELLERLVDATPEASTRIFLKGNHEDWIDQALARMPELFEDLGDLGIEISASKLMNLEKYGYEMFPVNHLVQIGNAHFTHGIYHGDAHAKKHLTQFKCSVFYGHLHDNQSYNQTSIYGNLEAASLGCLCRLDAKFLKGKPNNWVHGHGVFEIFPDGRFVRYFVPINDGRSSFSGIIFDGNEARK